MAEDGDNLIGILADAEPESEMENEDTPPAAAEDAEDVLLPVDIATLEGGAEDVLLPVDIATLEGGAEDVLLPVDIATLEGGNTDPTAEPESEQTPIQPKKLKRAKGKRPHTEEGDGTRTTRTTRLKMSIV